MVPIYRWSLSRVETSDVSVKCHHDDSILNGVLYIGKPGIIKDKKLTGHFLRFLSFFKVYTTIRQAPGWLCEGCHLTQ